MAMNADAVWKTENAAESVKMLTYPSRASNQ
jgi:hypothetical protein